MSRFSYREETPARKSVISSGIVETRGEREEDAITEASKDESREIKRLSRRSHRDTYHRGTGVHHQNPIAVHDGIESMGDRQHGALFEFQPDRRLYELVRSRVHVGRRFVQHEYRIVPDDSTRQTD